MIDTVETAASFGVSLHPKHPAAQMMTADPKNATETKAGFARLLENWLPLTSALNSLNRGMGLLDLYPFVLSTPVIEKLRFIHETVQEVQKNTNGAALKTTENNFEGSHWHGLTADDLVMIAP